MILDSSIVIEIYKGKATKFPKSVAMPSVVKYIIMRALATIKLERGHLIEREKFLYEFLDKCPTIDLDEKTAFMAGELSAKLMEKKINATHIEIIIAATAISNSKPLITKNSIFTKMQKVEKNLELFSIE